MANPITNTRFRVEIAGIDEAGFTECTGFDATTDVIDYREGNDPPHLRKLAGLTKYGNVTLKWGLTDSDAIWKWRKDVIDGKSESVKKNISIVLLDTEGNEHTRWEVTNAWPSKYDPADLNAKGNDAAIETLEITHEGIKRS